MAPKCCCCGWSALVLCPAPPNTKPCERHPFVAHSAGYSELLKISLEQVILKRLWLSGGWAAWPRWDPNAVSPLLPLKGQGQCLWTRLWWRYLCAFQVLLPSQTWLYLCSGQQGELRAQETHWKPVLDPCLGPSARCWLGPTRCDLLRVLGPRASWCPHGLGQPYLPWNLGDIDLGQLFTPDPFPNFFFSF